jgi:hypothetical protein
MSASGSCAFSSGHSMFDWPLHTQTSPIATSRTTSVLCPAIVISKGPPGSSGFSRADHCPPRASAVAV